MSLAHKNNFLLLIQRLLALLLLFTICRFFFLVFNLTYFRDTSFISVLADFIYGIRFDISAIVMGNIFFIALHFFPFRFFYSKGFGIFLSALFYLVNIPFLLFNSIDLALFRFAGKRATTDVFRIMSFGEDFSNTLPKMIVDFWYILLVFILLSILLIFLYRRIKPASPPTGRLELMLNKKWIKILSYPLLISCVIIGFRGGIQYRPINILSASRYGTGAHAALVLNTSFSILKTLGKDELKEVHYFSPEEAEKISPVLVKPRPGAVFRPLNVVIIILESLGKEYVGKMNNRSSWTPFLDSLIGESLLFDRAYANGKRSIEGIPAIVSGIPALMSEPYITSAYAGNSISSVATLLKKKGYHSSFFHGGTNGTMGFDNFMNGAGFDRYFGRKEYNNDNDFDGSWGIYDEPFLQRFAQELDKTQRPFVSALFTISSHHPYVIPEKYLSTFGGGNLPIYRSIQYADYSLRRFFETVSKTTWYDSTLFVLTADHTSVSEHSFYQSRVGMYAVPILFFRPGGLLKGVSKHTTQQIDILPGILDYLGYDENYFSFGSSPFDTTTTGYAFNFLNDTYQVVGGEYTLILDTLQKNFLYHYTSDSLLRDDLVNRAPDNAHQLELKMKAMIQNFNFALINNKMKNNGRRTE